jgi:hypothetical protein
VNQTSPHPERPDLSRLPMDEKAASAALKAMGFESTAVMRGKGGYRVAILDANLDAHYGGSDEGFEAAIEDLKRGLGGIRAV